MKVGIIKCQQTEDLCPGTACLKVAKEGNLGFEEIGPSEIIGFVSCGGCPGKKAAARAKMMVDRGAEAIVFASCISKGTPIEFACPNWEEMRKAVSKRLGEDIRIIEYTH